MSIIKIRNEQGEFIEIPVIQGAKGDTGKEGPQGPAGADGKTPVKGKDYFTEEDIASLNIPKNTEDLNNNSGFIKCTQIKKIEIVEEYPSVEEQGVLYLKVVE